MIRSMISEGNFHDKYVLGVKIGRGAFGQVRVVTKVSTGPLHRDEEPTDPKHERAVKILDLRDEDKPEELSAKLQKAAHKEATVWKAIGSHPNCIRLHDLFFGDDCCYMVMEKCNSGLLQSLASMPELTKRGLGHVFAQMLLGVAHCHRVKVVHRDIKPDNFLVGGEDGEVIKLCEFGLSALLPKQGKLRGVFGTAPYLCPEMLSGQWYDEKADVWSVAVIAYVLLLGDFPYVPKQQSAKMMKQAILEGAVPSFEPAVKAFGPNATFCSAEAVDFLKTLLDRVLRKLQSIPIPNVEHQIH